MDSAPAGPGHPLPIPMSNTDTPQLLHHASPADGLDSTPSRQSRLLQYRNARFTGKRLSISKLERKLSLRGSGKKSDAVVYAPATYNKGLSSSHLAHQSPGPISNVISSGILDNISNRQGVVDRPRADSTATEGTIHCVRPFTSRSQSVSPLVYEHSPQDRSLSPPDQTVAMRLREVSGNERRNPYASSSPSNSSVQRATKRRSMPTKSDFDAENYIQHIEDELKQAKDAICSPTINKSLQHQLKSAAVENERLRREIAELRNAFETEVKSTIEHKALVEVGLRKKIRDLETDLDCKASALKDLECQHEEKRLDGGTFETLRATIEKLEQEKASMVNENRSMSKRNEVLSELLALSPGKSRPAFELRSPTREKRPGRPLSLVIPRLPTSPNATSLSDWPVMSTTSPALSTRQMSILGSEIAHLSLQDTSRGRMVDPWNHDTASYQLHDAFQSVLGQTDGTANASNTQSGSRSSPTPFAIPLPSSPINDTCARPVMKRKPRKFMSGSTQLKPFLLPTLASDAISQTSSSGIGSPGSTISRDCEEEDDERDSYFPTLGSPIVDSAVEPFISMTGNVQGSSASPTNSCVQYQTVDEILAEHDADMLAAEDGVARSADFSPMQQTGLLGGSTQYQNDSTSHSYDEVHITRRDMIALRESSSASVRHAHGSNHISLSHPHYLGWSPTHQMHLARTLLDASPSSAVGSDARLSNAVPEPLFSPLARRSNHNILNDSQRSYHGHNRPPDHRSLKRRQSRSGLGDAIIPTNSTLFNSRMLFPSNQLLGRPDPPLLPISNNNSMLSAKPSPSSHATTCYRRARTPLEIIQNRQFGARPLAMMTIRTICTTIAQCTSFVRDLKQDPWALARRVIANAWFANWRQFGRLSWWVLGLFLPQATRKPVQNWDWDEYDGDAIAQRCCEEDPEVMAGNGGVHDFPLTSAHDERNASDLNKPPETRPDQNQNPGWCKSVFLWGKFSFAIMLAVGGAVVKGPAAMLRDTDRQDTILQHRPNEQGGNFRPCCTAYAHNKRGCQSRGYGEDIEGSSQDRLFFDVRSARRSAADVETSSFPHRFSNSPQSFTFRSPSQLSELQTSHHAVRPPDDRTLRPAKSRKRYVGDVFDQTSTVFQDTALENSDLEWSTVRMSRQASVDEGILAWPPSPDFIRPEDSVSLQNE